MSSTKQRNREGGNVDEDWPAVTVLIENPRKSTNWGPLLRCCAAFGISQIFVVGFDKCSVDGSHGASKHVELVAFHTHEAALQALKDLNFELVGLLQSVPEAYDPIPGGYPVTKYSHPERKESIVQVSSASQKSPVQQPDLPTSYPLSAQAFSHRTCLAVGKSAQGLPLSLAKLCDHFVHIPVHGLPVESRSEEEGSSQQNHSHTGSWLTPEAGLSIALHEFSQWAGYDQGKKRNGGATGYQGQKYDVRRTIKGSADPRDATRKHKKGVRLEALRVASMEDPLASGATDPFDDGHDDGDY